MSRNAVESGQCSNVSSVTCQLTYKLGHGSLDPLGQTWLLLAEQIREHQVPQPGLAGARAREADEFVYLPGVPLLLNTHMKGKLLARQAHR